MAALKEREIEARGAGKIVSRADELALLTKMVKSRQESAAIYAEAGRKELAPGKRRDRGDRRIPAQADGRSRGDRGRQGRHRPTGAKSIKDMGKVVNALKAAHPGEMDFAKASAIVKGLLSG